MTIDLFHEGRWYPATGAQMALVITSATGLTVPSGADAALIQAQGGAVRYRDDGTSPTATVGILIADGDSLFYTGDLAAIEFIQDSGSSATVSVLYYDWDRS